jgi:hypothetical protein
VTASSTFKVEAGSQKLLPNFSTGLPDYAVSKPKRPKIVMKSNLRKESYLQNIRGPKRNGKIAHT